MSTEQAFVFGCGGESLVGVTHHPDVSAEVGIVMVVGGPQYRVGSHRQFVDYARSMAQQNIAVLRFDYRGMGDSTGPYLEFEDVAEDLAAAMDVFVEKFPGVKRLVLFGLCDAASVALMHGANDERVSGMILMNPWVRNAQTEAQVVIKHYYGRRFLQKAFWEKLFSGKINIGHSISELIDKFRSSKATGDVPAKDFRSRMLAGAESFAGPVLLIMSGDDLTANEFEQLVDQSDSWTAAVRRQTWQWSSIPKANHTFARSDWKQKVTELSLTWINQE